MISGLLDSLLRVEQERVSRKRYYYLPPVRARWPSRKGSRKGFPEQVPGLREDPGKGSRKGFPERVGRKVPVRKGCHTNSQKTKMAINTCSTKPAVLVLHTSQAGHLLRYITEHVFLFQSTQHQFRDEPFTISLFDYFL